MRREAGVARQQRKYVENWHGRCRQQSLPVLFEGPERGQDRRWSAGDAPSGGNHGPPDEDSGNERQYSPYRGPPRGPDLGCRSISTNRSAAVLPRPSASWRGPQLWGCPSVRLESSPCSPHLWRCKSGYPNWARSTQWSPPAPAMSSVGGVVFSSMGSTKWKWFCGCSAMQ